MSRAMFGLVLTFILLGFILTITDGRRRFELRGDTVVYDDGEVVSVRVLSVPVSERFPDGIKYKFHYGNAEAEPPIIRYDNHHGIHELHIGGQTYEIDYPGLEAIYEAWRAALPSDKRNDW